MKIIKNISMEISPRKGSIRRFLLRTGAPFLMVLFYGCVPVPPSISPIMEVATGTFSFPPVWTGTASPTEFPKYATNTTTLTQTVTETPEATTTTEPSSTKTAVPTHRPTPTRGLPPTITLSPKEECPPPTYAKVDIHFENQMEDYGPQILEYFRANGGRAQLEEQLEKLGITKETINAETGEKQFVFSPNTAQFSEADLTGDLVKETVIILKQIYSLPVGRPGMGIFIIGCRAGQYQLLGSVDASYDRNREDGTKLIIRDLNANGIGEIIISTAHDTGSNHADVQYYHAVFEWNGKYMRSLFAAEEYGRQTRWIESFNRPLELRDVDGNGTTEFLFPNDFFAPYCGLGPYRLQKDIYMWDGEFYRYVWTDRGTPKYQFQAAFDGDYFASIGLYDKSEKMYQQALTDSKLKEYLQENPIGGCSTPPVYNPDEPLQIMAYARFRALELHTYLHKVNDAEKDLNYLVSNYQAATPGYLFASWADIFWKAYQADNNIDDACSAVVNAARPYEKDGFGLMNYGDLNPGPSLDTICPFHSDRGGE